MVPSGAVSGVDTIAISVQLAKMKARRHSFAYYDAEDIAQEIWLAVNKASGKFDPARTYDDRGQIQFFNIATENALRNLRRDNKVKDDVNISDSTMDKQCAGFEEDVMAADLAAFIRTSIPTELLKYFDLMLSGYSERVPSYTKQKIRSYVSRLLDSMRDD
jgi:DNA-directed RNA polymerase specialized sigma24 family protein